MNVVVANLHSALNLGDNAITQATLSGLAEARPDASVTVTVNDPPSYSRYADLDFVGSFIPWVSRLHGGRYRGQKGRSLWYMLLLAVSAVWFRTTGRRLYFGSADQRRLLDAYYKADIVLGTGGGYYYAYRPLSLFFVWSIAGIAFPLALGKRVVLLPQSVGPVDGKIQRWLAGFVFDRIERLMVRETASRDYVTNVLSVKRTPQVVPDLALAVPRCWLPSPAPLHSPTTRIRIGATLMDYASQITTTFDQSAYEERVCHLLASLARQYSARIELFCQVYGPTLDQDDRIVSQRVFERLSGMGVDVLKREDFHEPKDILAAYGDLDLLVGTRLHSGILALCAGVPVLLIGYLPKSSGTMALLGLGRYCCDIRTATPEQLHALACELLNGDRQSIRELIRAAVERASAEAHSWVRVLET